jgi:hypothetical protein
MTELDLFFKNLGWEKLEPDAGTPTYVTSYATAFIKAAAGIDDVRSDWASWQADLSHLRKHPKVGSRKDLYLIILIPVEKPETLSAIQAVLDDTHVCRKIILNTHGKTVPEALSGLAMLNAFENGTNALEADLQLQGTTLPKQVMADLAKKGVSAIFDGLISGKYRHPHAT